MTSRLPDMQKYTIGWLCALPIELAAAQLLLDVTHGSLPYDPNDDVQYTLGSIGSHNVVIGCLPSGELGIGSAAAVARGMRAKFPKLRFGLMVGIGGGVPSSEDIRLGDVVVSQPYAGHGGVVQYDFGKSVPDRFVPTGFLNAPPPSLLQALVNLQARHLRGDNNISTYLATFESTPNFRRPESESDILFKPMYDHIEGEKTCRKCDVSETADRGSREHNRVVVHYGTIASGNRVVKNARERDLISSKFGGVLCFEMEAAGLMNNWPCLVIRGICDYADSHKNKGWQPYAAGVAAAFAKEILSVIPATDVDETHTVREAMVRSALEGMLQTAIDNLNLDQLLSMLSVVDQDRHISTIPPLDCNHPMFYWIFWNMDFKQWSSAECSQCLWLSGPPERNIHQVSSYIIGREKNGALGSDHFVLYFFCSVAFKENPIIEFVHTLLSQIVCCSPRDKRISIIRSFFYSLIESFKEEATPWNERGFKEDDSPYESARKLLNAPADDLLTALGIVMGNQQGRCLLVVIDGLDKAERQRDEFIKGVYTFVEYLREKTPKTKILVTSRPLAEIKYVYDRLPSIEYDKERKGSSAPYVPTLYQTDIDKECLGSLCFENTRYDNISQEHEGSFEWIWDHIEYKNWSTPNASRLLHIEGKPGSGKSTFTKYFVDHLRERETTAESALVAKSFYSHGELELQRSHYNMLQSILYNILDQDEGFFYHRFQTEYRAKYRSGVRVDWDDASLKTVLKSLQDYLPAKRVYLIIDAMDESEERDRRHVFNLLFDLCSKTKYCVVKALVTSRPMAQISLRSSQFHNSIKLQDETKSDITSFASSFLDRLNLTYVLTQAVNYIVENAQGVFIWVKLVGDELLTYAEKGCSEEEIFEFLRQLPTGLKPFYIRMLDRMSREDLDLQYGIKMFQFVLFGARLLTVNELLHALAIPDNPNTEFSLVDDSFQRRISSEQRIIHCGGNFLEIKPYHGNKIVQVIHRTVRDFFLDANGYVARSDLRNCNEDVQLCISVTCIRYLMLCAANTSLAKTIPDLRSWTSEHFEAYARYLDGRPLANYALRYLRHHVDSCGLDTDILNITSNFIDKLAYSPTAYLLETWVRVHLNKTLLSGEHGSAAEDFRNNVLHAAVRKGFLTAAEVLLTAGADVNARDNEGRTPLWCAAARGHEAVARLLLAYNDIKANLGDEYGGQTPLSRAAEGGHENLVRLLLARNDIEADSKDKFGQTPLSHAAAGGHETVARLLLARSDVTAGSEDKYGQTPLSRAAAGGYEALVRLLLASSDVRAYSEDKFGQTPLSHAAAGGHEMVVRLLLARRGVSATSKDKYGQTPLSRAAAGGHEAVIDLLRRPWAYSGL